MVPPLVWYGWPDVQATSDTTGAERPLRRDAELNRQRVLTAAADAFAEGGLAVTMDEIARRAGVGVGTVYRRFPDKELLVEALFEQRIDELVALAEAAREEPDPFAGLVRFFESFLTVQAVDRGLKEVVLGSARGAGRAARARDRIGPIVDDLLARALAAGAVRPDVAASDLALIQFMLGAVIDFTHDVAPETWRRMLAIVLDGLRPEREATSALPAPALDERELERAMDAWRVPARRRPPSHESPAQPPA
jgi:AcrR family transcriptional regulator